MVLSDHLRDRLRRQYCDPPRHYHTFEHASAVAERVADLVGNRACVLAAWFHDAVYQPTASDNEALSAVLLTDWLAHDPDVDEAARLVRLTANHDPASGDRQGAILCDADLATLGGSPTDYAAYRQDVRKEYAHVPDQQWRTGRAAVLRGIPRARPDLSLTPGLRPVGGRRPSQPDCRTGRPFAVTPPSKACRLCPP